MEFKNLITLKEHKAAIYALCQAEKEHIIFSGGSDRHVIRWNLKTLKAEKVVAKSPTTIISLLFIKEYNYLLIGQIEGGVHVIDLKVGKEIKYLKLHEGYVFDLKYLPKKNELIASSGDGSISIWSITDFKLLYHKKVCKEKIRKIDLSDDYKNAALALGDNSVSVLDTEDWSEKVRIKDFSSVLNVVRFTPNQKSLLIGEKDAYLSKVDLNGVEKDRKIPAHNWAIYDIQFSPDSRFFATASRDKTVKVWDASQFSVLKRFEGFKDSGHTHSVNILLWSKYKDYLLSAGDDSSLKIWQISD